MYSGWNFKNIVPVCENLDFGNNISTLPVGDVSRALKILTKELGCPILALSQLNRANEQRSSKRPTLADLRDSGAIEQDADSVMLIHNEDA